MSGIKVDQKSVLNRAALLKVALVKRAEKIKELSTNITLASLGEAPTISDDRFETMEHELQHAMVKQNRESLIYATLRWVLGITDDINEKDLDLKL